jgi:hypothetical protein
MKNYLKNYRAFIFAYEVFLRNIEMAIHSKLNTQKRIFTHCQEARNNKIYNIAHRAKIELHKLKSNKQVNFSIVLTEVQQDTTELTEKIEKLFNQNNTLLNNHDFIEIIHWYNGFCEFIKDIRTGNITKSTWTRTNTKNAPPSIITLSLENIFSDSQNLEKLVELLIEKKYVSNEAGRLTWTGIEHETARGRGYQLIALSEVCRPLYVKKEYQAKELHSAWTSYFNFDIAVNNWQPSLKHKISDSYFKLFSFVRHSLKFN